MPKQSAMELARDLSARFKAEAAAHVDAVFELATVRETLATFSVRNGVLAFEPAAPVDVRFVFDHAETARALLLGDADPMAAFMAGRFRSDGHLPLAFVLLGLFRPDYGVAPPD